jgi:rfaE bifunctional protein kinase chain/domain
MDAARLHELLSGFARARVLVVGDFFLDRYLILDATLTEISIETGLEAYQVIAKRLYPGAAGTVTNNLTALGAGSVRALGIVGNDGEGFDLRAGLHARGVDTALLIAADDRCTPCYTKPMLREHGAERELNRQDIKNRTATSAALEAQIIDLLRAAVPHADAVIVADQVVERNCGVITDAVRAELAALSDAYPRTVFIADSRARIGEYRHLWIKPNRDEAAATLSAGTPTDLAETARLGRAIAARNGRPLFITLAEAGILAVDAVNATHVPTLWQTGPIDICGAGDSTMAGITLALCAGATLAEAAVVGNLVASLTVQQIGVTGTATIDDVAARFAAEGAQFAPREIV